MSIKNKMLIYLTLLMVGMLSYWGEAIQAEYNIQQVEQLKGKKEILFQKQETLQKELQEILKKENVEKTADILFSIKMSKMPKENLSVEEQIRSIAREHNFKWENYLVKLAFLESSFNPNAKNVNKSGSVDRGVFQINDYWHKEVSDECCFSVVCATEWTIDRINAGYQHEWIANEKAKRK